MQDPELSGLHRQVVDEDGVEDDPADGEQPEGGPIARGEDRQLDRHVVDPHRDQRRRGKPSQRRDLSPHMPEGQQPQ